MCSKFYWRRVIYSSFKKFNPALDFTKAPSTVSIHSRIFSIWGIFFSLTNETTSPVSIFTSSSSSSTTLCTSRNLTFDPLPSPFLNFFVLATANGKHSNKHLIAHILILLVTTNHTTTGDRIYCIVNMWFIHSLQQTPLSTMRATLARWNWWLQTPERGGGRLCTLKNNLFTTLQCVIFHRTNANANEIVKSSSTFQSSPADVECKGRLVVLSFVKLFPSKLITQMSHSKRQARLIKNGLTKCYSSFK